MKIKLDWFLWGMLFAVVLAAIFPEPGAEGGFLHARILNKIGVALIFFLHGVGLPLDALRKGVSLWKVHVVVQLATFLLFPIIGILTVTFVPRHILPADLALGFFYLCAVPSTVSSSVAFTAVAKGNVAAALFNATISSVLGVLLTPLWVGWLLRSAGQPWPLGNVLRDLTIWLILPLVVGQCVRPWLGSWATRHKAVIGKVDRVTILMLVYTSFCDSVKWGIWSNHGVRSIVLTLLFSVALFYIVFFLLSAICRQLKFSREDRIATLLCGSKKTLASAVPMARLIFVHQPDLGLILLPIMIYHSMQLLICGVLAEWWGAEQSAVKPSSGQL